MSKRKKITCLTFYALCAFYASYAFYAFYAFMLAKLPLITSFTILLKCGKKRCDVCDMISEASPFSLLIAMINVLCI